MGFAAKLVIGQTHLIGSSLYGTCTTPANTAAKAVSLDGFTKTSDNEIMTGITIKVKFSYGNTAVNPTLNVNGTGAKAIKRHGTIAPGTSGITTWAANSVQSFTFDGTYWMMDEPFDLTQIWNAVYPVGSIYMSVNSTSPATLFGGTWVQIQNQFLLGCSSTYANGATGGEATHTLIAAEMPSHTHTLGNHTHTVNAHTHTVSAHTHTVAKHSHTLSAHTHSVPAHAHGLNGHTHTVPSHYHGLGSHKHSVNAAAAKSMSHMHPVTLPPGGGYSGYTEATSVYVAEDKTITSLSATGNTDAKAAFATGGPSVSNTADSSALTSGAPSVANTSELAQFNTGSAGGGNTGETSLTTNGAKSTISNTGSGGAHNNMPPYLAVYIWKRTA